HGLVVADKCDRPAEDTALRRWLAVQAVEPGSPAAEAGVKPGDVVEQVGDLPVATSIDLERALFEVPAKPVPVRLKRGGSAETVEVALNLRAPPAATPADQVWAKLGLRLSP